MTNLLKWLDLKDLFGIEDTYFTNHNSKQLRAYVDENEDAYIIHAETPGLKEDELDVQYKDDVITINAEYKEENEHVLRSGKYRWSWGVRGVNAEKVEAKLKDGILSITLPKQEEKKPKRIEINKGA